jgi:hypothetical protein
MNIVLVAKTIQSPEAFAKLIDYQPDSQDPMAIVSKIHCHYTLGMTYYHPFVEQMLEHGYLQVTISDDVVLATANRKDWHNFVRDLNKTDNINVKKLVSLLVGSFPEIFHDLPRTMSSDGQLMLR